MQISCPHIEKSCTAAYYSDRKLGVSQRFWLGRRRLPMAQGARLGDAAWLNSQTAEEDLLKPSPPGSLKVEKLERALGKQVRSKVTAA